MFIYRYLAIMVYSEKLLNIIALTKCEDNHTKKLIYVQKADDFGTWYVALGMWGLPICSNKEPKLTLTYKTIRQILFKVGEYKQR